MNLKKVSIIIPVFNEEEFIEKALQKVVTSDTILAEKEIIIVDDGSSDRTVAKIKNQSRLGGTKIKNTNKKLKIEFKTIFKKKNQGKGKALRDGFLASTGEVVLVQDADLEYDPADYPTLLEPFIKSDADVVYGSRFITHRPHRVLYFWHFVGNHLITLISNMLTNLNLSDIYCGYKVFKGDLIRKIAPSLSSSGFEIEAELTKKISKIAGLRIYEVGVSYSGRTFEEGKKIRWWHFFPAILKLVTS